MQLVRTATIALAAAVIASIAAAPAQDPKSLKGAVRVDGMSGTGGGFKRFGNGETDIANASRAIKPSEVEACKAHKIEFIEIPVAFDGLTIVVNKQNTWAKQLTVDQVRKIFSAAGTAKTWKDVDPSWPDAAMKVYSPGTDSGTFDYFKEVTVGKDGKIRPDMSVSEDDNVLVRGVEGDKNSIGFFGYAYYMENKAKLTAVAVVNPATSSALLPTHETIEGGTYAPFSRPLFIYVNKESMAKPAVAAYVKFAIENGAKMAEEVGYVKLPAAIYDRAKANVASSRTGTQMCDENGKERSGALADLYK